MNLRVCVEVPKGSGEVTAVDYDFISDESLSIEKKELTTFRNRGMFERTVNKEVHGAVSEITHSYDKPGTYFASARVKVNRDGDAEKFFTQVKNLARVRIIVTEADLAI